jgi:glycosyltransferase
MDKMKVSLILTTYNCKENLIGTLKSIEFQDYPDIEVVIKDGQSTDGTLDIIKDFANRHENVIWKSSPDIGIYDAMNQGYEISTGDIIAFFNDQFTCHDAVSKFVHAIENGGKDCMGVHSDLVYASEERVVRYWKMGQGKISKGWMPGHPTLYLKREVYEKYGMYDTKYKVSADYDFMVRVLKDNQTKLVYIPEVLISMYYGGTSTNNVGSYIVSVLESYASLRENKVKFAWWVIFRRTLKVMGQFKKGKK